VNEVMSFFFTGRRDGVLWVQEEVEKLLAIYEKDQAAAYQEGKTSTYYEFESKISALREVLEAIDKIINFDKGDEDE
jgi:hypothetical protein